MCKFADNEGKEVKVVLAGGASFDGIVAGCDPDVGITIVEKDNTDHYLVCAHGMSSPVLKERLEKYPQFYSRANLAEDCDEVLEQVMEGIDKGVLDCSIFGRVNHDASADNCSFG